MAYETFSKSLCEGMIASGVSSKQIAAFAGIPRAGVEDVLAGKKRLTDQQVLRIEKATGKTAGQFIAKAKEPQGPFNDLMQGWAAAIPVQKTRKSTSAKRKTPVLVGGSRRAG